MTRIQILLGKCLALSTMAQLQAARILPIAKGSVLTKRPADHGQVKVNALLSLLRDEHFGETLLKENGFSEVAVADSGSLIILDVLTPILYMS